jgi:hypothetical protein
MAIVDLGPEASAGFRGQNARRVSRLFEKTVSSASKGAGGGCDGKRANLGAAQSQRFSYAERLPRNPVNGILGKSLKNKENA